MGFIRRQEERLAERLLRWHYEKNNLPVPSEAALRVRSGRMVEEAHRIGARRGRNLMDILNDLIRDLKTGESTTDTENGGSTEKKKTGAINRKSAGQWPGRAISSAPFNRQWVG